MIAYRPFRFAFLSAALNGLVLLFSLNTPRSATAEIIPADRRTDWTAGTIVGVPGGIPNRTRIFLNIVTELGADPTGVKDASAIINNALVNCPEGQVVYVPAGTYKVNSRMGYQMGKNKTLRGAGPGRTIFKPAASFGGSVFLVGVSDPARPVTRAISAGATKGSTTVTVSDTADLAVGELLRIEAGNPPRYVHGEQNTPSLIPDPAPLGSTGGTLGWMFRATAKTEGTITFWPPLPMDISTMRPGVGVYNAYGAAGTIVGFGFEDFSIDATGSNMPAGISFNQAYGCWVKNVEVHHFTHQAIGVTSSINCEFRQNYVHHGGAGSGSEGFDLIGDDSWNLLEDNIVYEGGTINLNDANAQVSGNVIGYNYLYGHRVAAARLQVFDLDLGHGTQDTFNLVEGNIIGCLMGGDGYYGGASHNTIFRNWITATNPWGYGDGRRAIMLKSYNVYFNVVGNVLGTSDFPRTNNLPLVDWQAAHGGFYEITTAAYSGGDQSSNPVQTIYELGFPNIGNTAFSGHIAQTDPPDYSGESPYLTIGQKYDPNVGATIIRHGNYDYFNLATIWDESIEDHTLPNSLYLSAKPDWWPANLAWPPIGPDRTPMTGNIPAKARYDALGHTPPSPPTNVTLSAPPT